MICGFLPTTEVDTDRGGSSVRRRKDPTGAESTHASAQAPPWPKCCDPASTRSTSRMTTRLAAARVTAKARQLRRSPPWPEQRMTERAGGGLGHQEEI